MTRIIYQDETYQLFDCCCVTKVEIVGRQLDINNPIKQFQIFPHSLDCKVLQFIQEESIKIGNPIIIMKGNR